MYIYTYVSNFFFFIWFQTCHAEVQTDPVQVFSKEERIMVVPQDSHVSMFAAASESGTRNDHTYCATPRSGDTHGKGTTTALDYPTPTPMTPQKLPLPDQGHNTGGGSTCDNTPAKLTNAVMDSTTMPNPVFTSTPMKFPVVDNRENTVDSVEEHSDALDMSGTMLHDQDVSWVLPLNNSCATVNEQCDTSFESCPESDCENRSGYSSIQADAKHIVFEKSLDSLINCTVCSKCRSPVCSFTKVVSGTNIVYHIQYLCNHDERRWSAHPFLGSGSSKVPAGNVLVSAATLFSGLTYAKLGAFCKILNLSVISETTFYETQQQVLIPVVNQRWLKERSAIQHTLSHSAEDLVLAGDGRCDSPGFNAKYCNYSFMNTGNNKIVDFELVQVTQCGTSQAMEKYGFCKTLDRLLENKVPVTTVVTDRHVGVRSVVRKEYAAKGICHQFDVYHIANSFRKKLVELSKRKSHADLIPWIKSITNHVWFSSKNCDGNPDKLVELFTSICYHVAGKHRWSGYTHVSQCMHKPYTSAQQRKRKWLKNPTLQAVKNLVYDPRLLRDIRQINLFCHTGSIESFHSALLVYCPKRQEFDFPTMMARSQLAILHHNANVGRKQATVAEPRQGSTGKGELRYKPEWKKQSAAWRVRPVYESSTKDHIAEMVATVLEVKAHKISLPRVEKPPSKNIAKIPAPSKEDLIKKHVDRFQ